MIYSRLKDHCSIGKESKRLKMMNDKKENTQAAIFFGEVSVLKHKNLRLFTETII